MSFAVVMEENYIDSKCLYLPYLLFSNCFCIVISLSLYLILYIYRYLLASMLRIPACEMKQGKRVNRNKWTRMEGFLNVIQLLPGERVRDDSKMAYASLLHRI